MRLFMLLLTIFSPLFSQAQKHDYQWLFGDKTQPSTFSGPTNINFYADPPLVSEGYKNISMEFTNASICDKEGNLLFYSNGIHVENSNGQLLENGTGLNPGWAAEAYEDFGYPCSQGMLILPKPESDDIFYLFHIHIVPMMADMLFYSIVDISANDGGGAVLQKNQPLVQDTICKGQLTAIRHANGRDWWVLLPENSSNSYYRMLLTPEGVQGPWKQDIGFTTGFYDFSGSAVFSPDGTKYVRYDIANDLNIFDFDRCTGLLSNDLHITVSDSADIYNGGGGVAISRNSRYAYVSSLFNVYQFDLQAADIAASKVTVAYYDGFEDLFPTYFYMPALAPDGKIYISCANGVSFFHRINKPDKAAPFCGLEQHSVETPKDILFGMPYFPNFRQGPVDGSACDTLGLNNVPLANFIHHQPNDALPYYFAFTDLSSYEPAQWAWSFGDNTFSENTNPVHTFPGDGTYEVCLTVSNVNGSHTMCKPLTVGTSAAEEVEKDTQAIFIVPNPTTGDFQLQFAMPASFATVLHLHDLAGRQVLTEGLPPGATRHTVVVKDIAPGLYFYTVEGPVGTLGTGKVVLQR